MVNKYCVSADTTNDLFVGLRFHNGIPEVVFPRGYEIPKDDSECRKDIIRLLSVLQQFSNKDDGSTLREKDRILSVISISSYLYLIKDYLQHGYYTEKEYRYIEAQRGNINWKRTIQLEQPQIDNGNIVFLRYQIKKNEINENTLVSEIHKYCVYLSFSVFGWLFPFVTKMPQKPKIVYNKEFFLSVLRKANHNTFDDEKVRLFQSMINIITGQNEDYDVLNSFMGINHFETVWQKLIDFVFGEDNKNKYLPRATWTIIHNGELSKSSSLNPDTVMKWRDKIYVLDAKYYQYGITYDTGDLPATDSIQKQITYGKHISNLGEVQPNNVFSAFVMPYKTTNQNPYKFVSVGTADWEEYNEDTLNYAYVLGILLDTRWLLSTYSKHNLTEIEIIADIIEKSLSEYRDTEGNSFG